jgi:thiamine-monophosphate kinase
MEREFVHWLRHRLPPHPSLPLGQRDDGAILRWGRGSQCVLTVDMLTDGVDFELAKIDARRVGRKALAVNLSDLAAMAARPLGALVALALPRDGALALAKDLFEGLIPLAERYQLPIAGGDTNCWDGPLVISITLVGEVHPRGALTRGGARPGDKIVVTGQFGGSILGRHFDFEPRVEEAIGLKNRHALHAGIDVSDGLSLDLARLAEESGCGAELELHRIPIAPAAAEWARRLNDGSTPLNHALGDGEDFELILAVDPETSNEMLSQPPPACGLTCVGQFVEAKGLWQLDAQGARRPLEPRGFEH